MGIAKMLGIEFYATNKVTADVAEQVSEACKNEGWDAAKRVGNQIVLINKKVTKVMWEKSNDQEKT